MKKAYEFTYKTSPIDLWQLSMYTMYGSIVGTVNLIFIIAMVLLNLKFLLTASIILKVLMVFGLCLFTIIQPTLIYFRAEKQLRNLPQKMTLSFDDEGISIDADNNASSIPWSQINKVIKKPTLLVIQSSAQHGFILSNKVLGQERNDFYDFVVSKLS